MARKIGMDEAVRRFDKVGNNQGVIVCFDADSSCEVNFLTEIYKHFKVHEQTPGCSIQFKHPTFGTEYEPHTYLGIKYYELHLRYYNQAHAISSVSACISHHRLLYGGTFNCLSKARWDE